MGLYKIVPMRLLFPGIPASLLETLTKETTESICPLADQEEVEVIRTPEALLFKCSTAFFFTTHSGISDVETYRAFLSNQHTRRYMPIAYEIDEDPTLPERVLAEFANKHPNAACQKIQHMVHREGGKKLLLLMIPHEIVFSLFHQKGGQLLTTFSGPVGNLRKIPTLVPSVPEGGEDDFRVRRVFATPYKEGEYHAALAIHHNVLSEVIQRPNSGISIGPMAIWSP